MSRLAITCLRSLQPKGSEVPGVGFHDGKYSDAQKKRDKVLVRHAMVILESCVGMDGLVKYAYFNVA